MSIKMILLYVIKCPYLYLILAFTILCFRKASRSYINITKIISNYGKEIICAHKLKLLFIAFPICLSISINLVKPIDESIIDAITLSVSILISMFFSYIAFFDEYKISNVDDISRQEILKQTTFESSTIVSYEILISIILLTICIIYPIIDTNNAEILAYEIISISTKSLYGLIIYSLFIHMIMNLLILLKRYNVLKKYNEQNQS
ncbi:MAG: hypothetical protein NC395_10255 [Prevotella sp.]|nr:hypothetical protein [Prevotella sp.]